jgi:hypothetical protein
LGEHRRVLSQSLARSVKATCYDSLLTRP